MSQVFSDNLIAFEKRFPQLAEEVKALDFNSIGLGQSKDGGYFYARAGEEGKWHPFSNTNNPIAQAQTAVFNYQQALEKTEQPAVIVGLYPGFELEIVYKYFEERKELELFSSLSSISICFSIE